MLLLTHLSSPLSLSLSVASTGREIEFLNEYLPLTAKTGVYLCNLSERDFIRQKNKYLPKVKAWIDTNSPGELLIPFSVPFEQKLASMGTQDERDAYCKENKVKSMLNKIGSTGYKALSLQHFFTAGKDEVRAWTVRKGFKAPQAAGVIHGDMQNGFICAEIYNYEHFKEFGSEKAVKAKGKVGTKGKEYVMVDGDVCFFKFSPANTKKAK